MICLWQLRLPPGGKSCRESKPAGLCSAFDVHAAKCGLKALGIDVIHAAKCGLKALGVDVIHAAKCGLKALGVDVIHAAKCGSEALAKPILRQHTIFVHRGGDF